MHFELFDIDNYLLEKEKKKIILYGQGDMAYVTMLILKKYGIDDFIFANYDGTYVSPFDNHISREKLFEIYDQRKYNILWVENVFSKVESLEFEENGIDQVYSVRLLWENISSDEVKSIGYAYHNLFEQKDDFFFMEDVIEQKDGVYLFSLDAMVTERCSLKCKDCSNLMQYYCKPKNIDVEELANNINILVNKVDKIHDLRILGGEPFMNMDFVKLIEAFKDEKKIDKISIYTNATIFPRGNNEKVLEYLKCSKVVVRMSDYGQLSRELPKWIEWCQNNNVRYQVIKIDVWQDLGKLERHEYTERQLNDIYGNCECRNTPTVIDNKLFNCPYAANAYNLGAMRKNEADHDYIQLDMSLSSKDIDAFLYNRPYLQACRYCNGRNISRASIKPYIQVKQPLEYNQLYNSGEIKRNFEDKIEKSNQNTDLVSVVVPIYNAERTIEKCVYSITKQTHSHVQILLIDDGSNDSSADVCEKLAQQDSRIQLIRNDHLGVVHARNTGIMKAAGKYLIFVDADDYIDEFWIEKLVEGMQDSEFCLATWWNEYRNRRIPDEIFDRGQGEHEIPSDIPNVGLYVDNEYFELLVSHIALRHNTIFKDVWNKMYLTSIMQEVCKIFNDNITYGEDMLLVLAYAMKCNRFRVVDYVGYHYTVSDVSTIKKKYDLENKLINIGYVWKVLEKVHDTTCLCIEKRLKYEALQEFLNIVLDGMHEHFGILNYYYPYYGRLDSKKVILYGAGNVGKSYYKSIIKEPKVELVAWVDKNADDLREKSMLPVENLNSIMCAEYDYIIVAVFGESTYFNIVDELVSLGVQRDKIIWNPTKPFDIY